MEALLISALRYAWEASKAEDHATAKKILNDVMEIIGLEEYTFSTGDDAKTRALAGYLEGMARDRASAATTLAERQKRDAAKGHTSG